MIDSVPTTTGAEDGRPLAAELALAIRLAREAGEIVKTFYAVPFSVRWKDPTEPVTEADRAANVYIVRQICQAFPDDGILAEESKDDLVRLEKRRVWIVDPLDGTKEFIAHNGQFCLMIGLSIDGVPVLGVVHQPVDNILFAAVQGQGAFMEAFGEHSQVHVSETTNVRELRPIVSRSHRPPILDDVLKALGARKERQMGSAGLKIGVLVRAQADFYLHPSPGLKEWDTCAPNAILHEAGGRMTDCWNRPLVYNQRDVRQRFGMLASNGVSHVMLADSVAALLDDAGIDPEFGF